MPRWPTCGIYTPQLMEICLTRQYLFETKLAGRLTMTPEARMVIRWVLFHPLSAPLVPHTEISRATVQLDFALCIAGRKRCFPSIFVTNGDFPLSSQATSVSVGTISAYSETNVQRTYDTQLLKLKRLVWVLGWGGGWCRW